MAVRVIHRVSVLQRHRGFQQQHSGDDAEISVGPLYTESFITNLLVKEF